MSTGEPAVRPPGSDEWPDALLNRAAELAEQVGAHRGEPAGGVSDTAWLRIAPIEAVDAIALWLRAEAMRATADTLGWHPGWRNVAMQHIEKTHRPALALARAILGEHT